MSEQPTVRVETADPAETDDLLEALSVRGLTARRIGPAEVELEAAPEEAQAWSLEIVSALEAWLEESEQDALVARLGTQSFTVKAPDRRIPVAEEDREAPTPARRVGAMAMAVAIALVFVLAIALWLLVFRG